MNKEYGGYLPLELKKTGLFYSGDNVVALNSARNAIVYAYKAGRFDKLYLPFYMCESVKETLNKYCVNYELYHFSDGFNPLDVNLKSNEVIVYPMFYGCETTSKADEIVKKYGNVIFDNTQSFFLKPHKDAYNVYSCRKFFGVSDGAYLVREGIKNSELDIDIEYDYSSTRAIHLLKSIELGTNYAYDDSLKSEEDISDSGIRYMSKLTETILDGIDYEFVKERRRNNYLMIDSWMKEHGFLSHPLEKECVPMVYPFIYENDEVRHLLVKNKIFVPQWWKYLIDDEGITEFELKLSNYLYPLPVDQRYSCSDIDNMLNTIGKAIKDKVNA